MYFRKIFKISIWAVGLAIMNSCDTKLELGVMDPLLVNYGTQASWWDTNTIYTFKDGDTLKYGKKHLRSGVTPDTVLADSAWGILLVDQKRNNLTFDLKGYITKSGKIVTKDLNSTTWNYSITNDTTLNYESSTTVGTLTLKQ